MPCDSGLLPWSPIDLPHTPVLGTFLHANAHKGDSRVEIFLAGVKTEVTM
jgi:hypothetical protein